MRLIIQPTDALSSINDKIQEQYPHLKVKFFNREHDLSEGNKASDEIAGDTIINTLGVLDNLVDLHFQGNTKVKTFEQELQDTIGCGVQVFRKSGNIWLQTTVTDEWTLHHQEEAGVESDA